MNAEAILTVLALSLVTACAMEFVAYVYHRFVMHGAFWSWHRWHHGKNAVSLNHNDLFVVAPAVTSFFLILIGTTRSVPALIGIGAGMALYGISYLLFHEMLVHKRFTKSLLPKNPVLQKLVQAHLTHHASTTKDGCVNFGFFVPDPLAALKALMRINLFR